MANLSRVALAIYAFEGLLGCRGGNSSRGTGRMPFSLLGITRSGWYDRGTSTKLGDSGGIESRAVVVAKERR